MGTMIRQALGAAGLLAILVLASGCSGDSNSGEVTGTVTVDGKKPEEGASITFFPMDGKSPSAGATLDKVGKYTVKVPIGACKVEIRAPKSIGRPTGPRQGPGADSVLVEESLPAKFNDASELRFDVKAGKNEKNWELNTK